MFISVTEEYRKLREIQTFLNRLVWSTELCYSYFLSIFDNNDTLQRETISEVFDNLPIQAWFKNKNGTGKYNLTLKEHNDVVRANQVYVCRSSIILYNSYFDDYLNNRVNTKFQLFLNLTNADFKTSKLKVDPKDIFKADCCRIIRNMIVHQPANTFLSIKEIRNEIKEKITSKLNKRVSFLQKEYADNVLSESLNKAINEVIDSAIIEVEAAGKRNVPLPYEFFFMLYTFTNYNAIAAKIEQVLFYDGIPKTFFNRVDRRTIHNQRQAMIADPAVTGLVYNSESKKPIQSAIVQVLDNPFNGKSDDKGNYYLTPNLKDGSYKIEIYADGFESKTMNLNTLKGKTLTIDIGLKPM